MGKEEEGRLAGKCVERKVVADLVKETRGGESC